MINKDTLLAFDSNLRYSFRQKEEEIIEASRINGVDWESFETETLFGFLSRTDDRLVRKQINDVIAIRHQNQSL